MYVNDLDDYVGIVQVLDPDLYQVTTYTGIAKSVDPFSAAIFILEIGDLTGTVVSLQIEASGIGETGWKTVAGALISGIAANTAYGLNMNFVNHPYIAESGGSIRALLTPVTDAAYAGVLGLFYNADRLPLASNITVTDV